MTTFVQEDFLFALCATHSSPKHDEEGGLQRSKRKVDSIRQQAGLGLGLGLGLYKLNRGEEA